LTGGKPQRRYLWTDAFAVCNLLGVGRIDDALALIDRVHHVLGRHRADDPRRGWISGLSEADGDAHPTLGGLRIGKPMPERPAGEPPDDQLEWDRGLQSTPCARRRCASYSSHVAHAICFLDPL